MAVVVDVTGYYDGTPGGQLLHPVAPERQVLVNNQAPYAAADAAGWFGPA